MRPGARCTKEMDVRTTDRTSVAEAAVRRGDDGRHAARVLMLATGVLFGFILLLQAIP